jgi:hypothetical protein
MTLVAFTRQNSTAALGFVLLPIYQLAVVVPLSFAAWWAAAKSERS